MTIELLIVTGPSYHEAQKQIHTMDNRYNGIELRVDLLETIDLRAIHNLITLNKKKTMLTLRSEKEGGQYKGAKQEQIELIRKLLRLNIDYMDIEYTLASTIISKKTLCSFHNHRNGIENLDKLYKTLKKNNPASLKICIKAESQNQVKKYLNFLVKKRSKNEIITLLSPNKIGLLTRRLGPTLGNAFSFTPAESKNKKCLNAIFT